MVADALSCPDKNEIKDKSIMSNQKSLNEYTALERGKLISP